MWTRGVCVYAVRDTLDTEVLHHPVFLTVTLDKYVFLMSSSPHHNDGDGGAMLHTSPSGNHVTAVQEAATDAAASAVAADREVVTSDIEQERMGAILVAITDKLDALEKSARDKRAILESSGN